ncbi:MAG TPA: mechanosensitive ion channel family protein [Candidatus Saccharimonadales bacterium]|nr:mechanosensitive ion channel family protein [Candidatus Saccharimonadales bacterium]
MMEKHRWRDANIQLIPCGLVAIIGSVVARYHGNIHYGSIDHKLMSLAGVLAFVIFGSAFVHILTNAIKGTLTANRLGIGRAAALSVLIRLAGYLFIFLTTLELIGISVARLLLGGAIFGIILGVAAQQALGNFFASLVLILAHPFSVGENIVIKSGALGGEYVGRVKDIGLTHTRLRIESGETVFLPNSALLAGASVMRQKAKVEKKAE